jgi:hypothetical protein
MRDDIMNNGIVHRRLTGQIPRGPKCVGLHPNNFTLTELNAFCDATVIMIDLRVIVRKKAPTLESLIFQYIFAMATGTFFSSDRGKAAADNPEVLFDEIRKFNNEENRLCNEHYIVFFDEVAALESLIKRCPYYDDVNAELSSVREKTFESGETKKTAEVESVYQVFLNALRQIISAKNVYILAAGKSGFLGEYLSRPGINTSPLSLRMLVLEPFRTEHIKTILENTMWPLRFSGASDVGFLTQKFGLLDELSGQPSATKMVDFCSTFLDYTGGIPRYVQASLIRLWELEFSFTSQAELKRTLHMMGSDIISKDSTIAASGLLRMTHQDMVIFVKLLRLNLAQMSLPKDYEIPLLDGNNRPLLSWIGVNPIYIRHDEKRPTHIKTVFCKYLIQAIKRSGLDQIAKVDQGAKATVELLKLIEELQEAVDCRALKKGWIASGRVLELLLANFLICRLRPFSAVDENRKTFSFSFDFLSETLLASVVPTACVGDIIAPVISLPAITKVNGIITRAEANRIKDGDSKHDQKLLQEFQSAERQYLGEYDILQSNLGVPCLPVSENSAGPDVTIVTTLEGNVGLAKLMFAARNFLKTQLTFSDIEDAVKKAFKYRDFDDGNTPAFKVPGVLVIVSMNLGSEVKSWLNEGHLATDVVAVAPLRATTKKWKLIGSFPGLEGGSYNSLVACGAFHAKAKSIGQLLPEGCQLVVLNEDATEELLTERVISLLRDVGA